MPIVCAYKMQNFWIFGKVLGHIYLPPSLKGKPITKTRWTMLARGVLSFLMTWTVVVATHSMGFYKVLRLLGRAIYVSFGIKI